MADPVVTVEIAFTSSPLVANPVWVDVSAYVLGFDIRRGRQHELNRMEAGTCALRLDNMDRRFDPTNTASPYYPNVLPVRKLRIRATYSAVVYGLFQGFIEAWPMSWEEPLDGEITVTATDGFKYFNQVRPDVTIGGDTSGYEVDALLDTVGWPAADRAFNVGLTTIAAKTYSDTGALQIFQAIADAENGLFYIDGFGRAAFRDRHYRLVTATSNTSQATFGFAGGQIPYTTIDPAFDDTQIWNDVRVTADGGTEQTASDTTSQTAYFTRTLSKSGLIIGGPSPDAEALSAAQWLLANYKDPALRFRSITVSGHSDDSVWSYALGLEISNRITVAYTPPPASTVTQECYIESVQHKQSHGYWETTWQLSLAGSLAYLTLDHATLGQLDANRLAY